MGRLRNRACPQHAYSQQSCFFLYHSISRFQDGTSLPDILRTCELCITPCLLCPSGILKVKAREIPSRASSCFSIHHPPWDAPPSNFTSPRKEHPRWPLKPPSGFLLHQLT